MKIAIVYSSVHHENTKRIVDAMAEGHEVTLIDATQEKKYDLTEFDIIGFASGIYYSKFHRQISSFARENLPEEKRVFLVYTCGIQKDNYLDEMEEIIQEKGGNLQGAYCCLGWDTFGPFKLVGGIAKGHPNQEEIDAAKNFFNGII